MMSSGSLPDSVDTPPYLRLIKQRKYDKIRKHLMNHYSYDKKTNLPPKCLACGEFFGKASRFGMEDFYSHIEVCTVLKDEIDHEFMINFSKNRKHHQKTMESFGAFLTDKNKFYEKIESHINESIVNFFVAGNIPWNARNLPQFKEMIQVIGLGGEKVYSSVASVERLKTEVLPQLVSKIYSDIREKFELIKPIPAFLSVDGWQSITQSKIFGALVTFKNYAFPFTYAFEGTTGDDIAKKIELIILEVEELLPIRIRGLTTDQHSPNVKAKEILRRRFPYMIMLPCAAHQINLMGKCFGGLTNVSNYQSSVKKLIKIARHNSKFSKLLKSNTNNLYGKGVKLSRPIDIRWNSMYSALCSVLRIRGALMETASSFLNKDKRLLSQVQKIRQRRQREKGNNQDLTKEQIIKRNVDDEKVSLVNLLQSFDDDYLKKLKYLQKCCKPLARAQLKLQQENTTLSDVLETYLKISHKFLKISDKQIEYDMRREIKNRWEQLEQPIFLIAMWLDRRFTKTFKRMINCLSAYENFGGENKKLLFILRDCALRYYCAMFPNSQADRDRFRLEFGRYYANPDEYVQTVEHDDPAASWLMASTFLPTLGPFAHVVLSLKPQSSDCERLFSQLGRMKTKSRASLNDKLLGQMAALRYSLRVGNGSTKRKRKSKLPSSTELQKKRAPKRRMLEEPPPNSPSGSSFATPDSFSKPWYEEGVLSEHSTSIGGGGTRDGVNRVSLLSDGIPDSARLSGASDSRDITPRRSSVNEARDPLISNLDHSFDEEESKEQLSFSEESEHSNQSHINNGSELDVQVSKSNQDSETVGTPRINTPSLNVKSIMTQPYPRYSNGKEIRKDEPIITPTSLRDTIGEKADDFRSIKVDLDFLLYAWAGAVNKSIKNEFAEQVISALGESLLSPTE